MELKDVILSTLAEMEEENVSQESQSEEVAEVPVTSHLDTQSDVSLDENNQKVDNELYFLNSIRERLLVLFEGFQAPNNANIEAKIDMTLNFLEYTLATIDERIEKLEKGNE